MEPVLGQEECVGLRTRQIILVRYNHLCTTVSLVGLLVEPTRQMQVATEGRERLRHYRYSDQAEEAARVIPVPFPQAWEVKAFAVEVVVVEDARQVELPLAGLAALDSSGSTGSTTYEHLCGHQCVERRSWNL